VRHLAAILTVLLAAPAAADPAGWEHSVSGLLDLRVTDERRNTTPLAAPPAEAEATAIASTYAAGFEAWKGGLALASQLRAHTNSAGDNRARLRVDELYAEYAVTPEDFLYAGRRNIVYGASLGGMCSSTRARSTAPRTTRGGGGKSPARTCSDLNPWSAADSLSAATGRRAPAS